MKRALENDIPLPVVQDSAEEHILARITRVIPDLCAHFFVPGLFLTGDPDRDKVLWNLARTNRAWQRGFLFSQHHVTDALKKMIDLNADDVDDKPRLRIGRVFRPLFLRCLVSIIALEKEGISHEASRQSVEHLFCGARHPGPINPAELRCYTLAYTRLCRFTPGMWRFSVLGNLPNTSKGRLYYAALRGLEKSGVLNVTIVPLSGNLNWSRWCTNDEDDLPELLREWHERLAGYEHREALAGMLAFASLCMRQHYGSYEFQLFVHYFRRTRLHTNINLSAFARDYREVRVAEALLHEAPSAALMYERGHLRFHNPFDEMRHIQ